MFVTLAGLLALVGAVAAAYYFAMRPVTLRIAVGPANSEDVKVVQTLTQAFVPARGQIRLRPMQTDGAKASAQALFLMVTYGVGMYLGTEASGWLNQALTTKVVDPKTGAVSDETDWRTFWAVPAVGALVSLALFLLLT